MVKYLLYLIGYPVKHSVSPYIYSRVFSELGIEANYELLEVRPSELRGIIEWFRGCSRCLGFNVTIPHKVRITKYLNELTESAKVIGAVNTVKVVNGDLVGFNTDWLGFRYALERFAGRGGYGKALLVGAGGAGRAAAYALRDLVKELYIVSKSGYSAKELAREVMGWGIELARGFKASPKLCMELAREAELIVNASPVGMVGYGGSPVPKEGLGEGKVVFDMVYNPLETKLVRDAREVGCLVIDGLWMLTYQARENLRIWFGVDASADLLRSYGIEGLKELGGV